MDVGPLLLPLPEPIEVTAPHPPCTAIGSDCGHLLPFLPLAPIVARLSSSLTESPAPCIPTRLTS
eukprot:COSAG04_NODE_1047_length_8562_cov_9.403167_14_plen_65_part_00